MPYSHSLFQWVAHRKNLLAITWIAAAHAVLTPLEGKVSGKEALTLRRIAEFWKDGDYAIAQKQIRSFLDQFPESPASDHLNVMLGDLYFQEKNYQEAYTSYNTLTTDEFLEKTHFARLYCLSQLHDYEGLLSRVQGYFEKEHDKEELLEAHYLIADALLHVAATMTDSEEQQKLAQEALVHHQLLEGTRLQEDALFAYAELQKILKNHSVAITTYLSLAEKYPSQREDLLFQAATLQFFVDKSQALETFRTVADLRGKMEPAATFNFLTLLLETGQYDALIQNYEERSQALPENKSSLIKFYVGSSHAALHHFEEAKSVLRAFLEVETLYTSQTKKGMLTLLHCAQETKDMAIVDLVVEKMKKTPKDDDLARALLLRSQLSIDTNDFAKATLDLKQVMQEFPAFGDRSSLLYTTALLLSKEGAWDESIVNWELFVQDYPDSPHLHSAYRHLINCSLKLGDKPRTLTFVRLFLEKNFDTDKKDIIFLLGKLLYETGEFSESLAILNHYVSEIDPLSYEGHLIISNCHNRLQSPPEHFIHHAEKVLVLKPDFAGKSHLQLHLFNAYLQLGGHEVMAAKHLTEAFLEGNLPIKWENQLWLTEYFISQAQKDKESIAQAEMLMKRCLESSKDLLSLESLLLKYSDLLGANHLTTERVAILSRLVDEQKNNPTLEWKYQRKALFELAHAHEQQGSKEEALKEYTQIIEESSQVASYTGFAALLHKTRLQLALRTENTALDPEILNDLKELQIRKNIQSEPLHLEAALDYAKLRSQEYELELQNERYLHLLSRIKDDFLSQDDLISKEYAEERLQSPEKERLFQSYMSFVEAEILKLQGDHETANTELDKLRSLHDLHPYLRERLNGP